MKKLDWQDFTNTIEGHVNILEEKSSILIKTFDNKNKRK